MSLPAYSSLKCEHGTYKLSRSYPHTRVQKIRTSPPASITHLTSPVRTSPLITNPTYHWLSHQDHSCKYICNGPLPLPGDNSLSPSATRPVTPLFVAYRLAEHPLPPDATPIIQIKNASNYVIRVCVVWRFLIATRRFSIEPKEPLLLTKIQTYIPPLTMHMHNLQAIMLIHVNSLIHNMLNYTSSFTIYL